MTAAYAAAAGIFAALAGAEAVALAAAAVRRRMPEAAAVATALTASVRAVGEEGRDPARAERRRLLAAAAAAAAAAGWLCFGLRGALAAALAGAWASSSLLRARRESYARGVDAGAAELATSVAAALSGGHSLRGAIAEAAAALTGPAGVELRRAGAELAAGERTQAALAGMAARTGSARIEAIVAACLMQRAAGGDLARLLRELASGFADADKLEEDVRAQTAQARFTGGVVVALPAGGAVLAELASPGFVAGLAGSFLTAWLAGIAILLQAAAFVAIRRLGRVRV